MRVLADVSRLGAKRYGNKTALISSGRNWTYADLDIHAQACAVHLTKHQSDVSRIGIFARNSPEYLVAALGVIKTGAILAPFNFRYASSELSYVLDDSAVQILIIEDDLRDVVEKAIAAIRNKPILVSLSEVTGFSSQASFSQPAIYPSDAAVLMYTSGTTGRPKGVLFPHSSYFSTFQALIIEGDIRPGEVTLVDLPLFHQAALFAMILPTWMRGGKVVLGEGPFEPGRVLADVERHRVTLTMWVPTMIGRIVSAPELDAYDTSSLSKIYYGSAPIAAPLFEKARSCLNADFYQWYGLTETGLNAVLRPEDHESSVRSTGREVYNCEIRIVSDGRDVGTGEVGEVLVSSASHGMLGYLNNEAATREAFVDGWIRTGDLARREPDGLFTIVDRSKDMIISGAENIYPKEIEDLLRQHPRVADVAVFGIPDAEFGEAVCAAIIPLNAGDLTEQEALDFCVQHLARYKKPKKILFVEELPRNALGKVTKNVLRASFWEGHERKI